ncbi:hypothetical protein B0H17DRAFT_1141065 [Mycena rosella]|uniref:Uncharacterized protein n=1 Tax=Mycena rosella TaxID=1033263 RepID=A0AAD7GAL5_MYCRO|nr:hypothetical protein B0H17DRAFT_1141065 [Mycena rosella]
MGENAEKLIRFMVRMSKIRVKRGAALTCTREDLSSHLILIGNDQLDEDSPSLQLLPFAEYASNTFLAVVAGSDTAAHLVLSRLREEIDEIFPRSDHQCPGDETSKLAPKGALVPSLMDLLASITSSANMWPPALVAMAGATRT